MHPALIIIIARRRKLTKKILTLLVSTLIDKLITPLIQYYIDKIAYRKTLKQAKLHVKELMKVKDPKQRARLIREWLK